MYEHTFPFLRATLGPPARTFSYTSSAAPDLRDHVWRCGCGAREKDFLCELVPCGKHRPLNRGPLPRAERIAIEAAAPGPRGMDEAV
jgi:hypothetical protein